MSRNVSLRIAVCDDEGHIHDKIAELLDVYAENKRITYHLYHIYSGRELLEFKEEIDILLLDIDMPGMDGIAAAQELNGRGIEYKIIMLTSKVERFKDAFKIGAFRFVTKPVSENELFEALDEVRERMVGIEKVQVWKVQVAYEIIQRDILYIAAEKNVTRIYTGHMDYRSEQSLKMWSEQLDERLFFQCDRSSIVNLEKIARIEKEVAILVTGEKVPVSRRRRKDLLQAFIEYDTKRR